jgi:glutathionylspermidine synthase
VARAPRRTANEATPGLDAHYVGADRRRCSRGGRPAPFGGRCAKKPRLAREGANVTLIDVDVIESVEGAYDAEGYIYQALAPLPHFGADQTVIGSWIVGAAPAGIGIRADVSPVAHNASRFVPHYFI